MQCNTCSNELTLLNYTDENNREKLYGICFGCNEIFHIKQKKNGRSKTHVPQPQHIPQQIFLALRR